MSAVAALSMTWRKFDAPCGNRAAGLPGAFLALLIAGCLVRAEPKISFTDPLPPANGKRVFGQTSEGREAFLDVTIPPDLPDGTSVDVALSAIFEDDPASASGATMTVNVVTPLEFVSVEHDPTGFLTLGLSGPWNATYFIESSGDLSSWSFLTSVPATDGAEVIFVTVPIPLETPALFLRAYADVAPGLNRPTD